MLFPGHRKQALIIAAVLAILIMLSGCSSLPVAERPSRVESLVHTLRTSDVDGAVRLTRVPFLLDGEILMTGKDVELMWNNLKKVPDLFANAEIISIRPASAADYVDFAESSDIRVFFERALPEDPALVEIGTSTGSFLLLVSGKKIGTPLLAGMKGPLQ